MDVGGEVVVGKPVDQVFRLFANIEQSSEYSKPVIERTKITDGPAAVGTRYHARDRWPGREVEFTVEITEYAPPERLAASWSTPMEGGWRAAFVAVDGGTKVSFAASMKPSGVMTLLTPVLRPWAKRQTRSFLDSFKAWAEAQ